MRIRYKKWARHELEASSFYIDEPEKLKGRWKKNFKNPEQPIHLELGCGKGQFISKLASENLNINYIAVDFEGWTDENCDAVVRRVCEECGNKYFIPCIAQGGPGSVYPGVYKSLCDSIDKLNEEKFGIKASESTRLPWQIMF